MADLSDVGTVLVAMVAAAVYPNGTRQASVSGDQVIVYPGWPDVDTLNANLAAGKVHVSIWPRPGDKTTDVVMGDGEWIEATNNGTTGSGVVELRRQTRTFQVSVWASRPDHRDAIAGPIDTALAATSRLALPDGTQGLVSYVSSTQNDSEQRQGVYRRDLLYSVNYATTRTTAQFAIVATVLSVTPSLGAGVDLPGITLSVGVGPKIPPPVGLGTD